MDDAATACEVVLLLISLSAVLTSYNWIADPTLRSVSLWESLQSHPVFSVSVPLLFILFTAFGIHRRVVEPSIVRVVVILTFCRELLACVRSSLKNPATPPSENNKDRSLRSFALSLSLSVSAMLSNDSRFLVLVAMMMVVDATGLALVPWDRLSVLIIVGVAWFFKFFIVDVHNQ
ncbi:hypothetical protein ANCCEY_10213 [Ancylostoma ceylanicum]|uniref:Transmembrane protein 188 n=1 Tax=Ancylostoma ceylanicum TaxID=53326 RepID=A0A0D6LFE6_9BILA|nr:hypothetical protein ANCCEY_10213 [Ancylostoma ceylanicum]